MSTPGKIIITLTGFATLLQVAVFVLQALGVLRLSLLTNFTTLITLVGFFVIIVFAQLTIANLGRR